MTQEQINATIQARIDREFAMSAATLTAKRKPKPKAAIPKAKPRKPARLTRAQAERIDSTLTRIEGALCRTWDEAVAFIAERDHCSLAVAGRKACAEFPGLHPTNRKRVR